MRRLKYGLEEFDNSQLESPESFREESEIMHEAKNVHALIHEELSNLKELEDQFHAELSMAGEKEKQIAIESVNDVVEKIKEYWNKIVAFLKNIVNNIRMFFEKHFGVLALRKKFILLLLKKIKTMQADKSVGNIGDSSEISLSASEKLFFVKAGSRFNLTGKEEKEKFIGNADELFRELKEFNNILENILNTLVTNLQSRARVIAKAMNDFSFGEGDAVVEKLYHDLSALEIKKFAEHTFNATTIFNNTEKNTAKTTLRYNENVIEISTGRHTTEDVKENFTGFSLEEATKLLSELITIIETIESFKEHHYNELMKSQKNLENSASMLVQNFKIELDKNDYDDVQHLRDLLRFNTLFVQWAKVPTMKIIDLGTKVARHVCDLVEKDLKLFTKTN